MKDLEKQELYSSVISKWGIDAQLWMVVEECGELVNAIAKYKRGRVLPSAIIEELADVSIMVEQMSVYWGKCEFVRMKEAKLARLGSLVK